MKKAPVKSSMRTSPLDLLAGPLLGGGLPIPGFSSSSSSSTGPQVSSDVVSIPYYAPFFQGDGNRAGEQNSNPTASGAASAGQNQPANNLPIIIGMVIAGLVLLARR